MVGKFSYTLATLISTLKYLFRDLAGYKIRHLLPLLLSFISTHTFCMLSPCFEHVIFKYFLQFDKLNFKFSFVNCENPF